MIVPIGGTEQNGPHMTLGKHNVRVKALSEKIARALGNAVVAPVIAYVPEGSVEPPTGHMRYPGTITVPPDVYRKVLESAARSFRLAGFRDIVFLGDSRRLPAGQRRRRARAQPRVGGGAGARARDRRVLPRADRLVRAGAEEPRLSPTPRSARTRASPTRR